MSVNKIIYECLDEALSRVESTDKKDFFGYLEEKYRFDFEKLADHYVTIHKALQEVYGNKSFEIERIMIRILNQRGQSGVYERNAEVAAFGTIVNVFMKDSEQRMEKNKELIEKTKYARRLEDKVKEANDKLKTAERLAAIGETAAMVGHDIRNPLQAIVGELFLQKEDISTLPEGDVKNNLYSSIRSVEENIFYINKIVSDLQDFAKPLKPEKEKVDINSVIAEVMTIVPIPSNLQVDIKVQNEFPAFCASNQMLKRAIANLVQNAVQAMPSGGKLIIKAYSVQKNVEVTVKDTGEGIPEEVKPRLFKPLFTTKSKGQGLGLAVVKRLVEAMGGTVSFRSQEGDGAEFIIQLPIKTE